MCERSSLRRQLPPWVGRIAARVLAGAIVAALASGCAAPVKVYEGEDRWPDAAARITCHECRIVSVDGATARDGKGFGSLVEVTPGRHAIGVRLVKRTTIIPVPVSDGTIFVPLPTCGALFAYEPVIELDAAA
jgi:hypothetical protein